MKYFFYVLYLQGGNIYHKNYLIAFDNIKAKKTMKIQYQTTSFNSEAAAKHSKSTSLPISMSEIVLSTAVPSKMNFSLSPERVVRRALPTSPTLSKRNAAASTIPYFWHNNKQRSTL